MSSITRKGTRNWENAISFKCYEKNKRARSLSEVKYKTAENARRNIKINIYIKSFLGVMDFGQEFFVSA